ncbi:hypothetical protein LCGC14_2105920 [marine sediment metagenome]|uniref:DUF1360 domain-containing protein n=1 Tax=marine sediment metagenome TaxID=412755 RepID=A0A0F9E8S5_9ZZZZ
MIGALLLATATTAAYYLLWRAEITRWLWSRYPFHVERLIGCAACSGTWYGFGLGWVGRELNMSVLGVTPNATVPYLAVCALIGLVWTPILAYLHTLSWSALSGEGDNDDSNA